MVYIGHCDSLCVAAGDSPENWVEAPLADFYAPELSAPGARAQLARPVSAQLCFAGEACSRQDYSTAPGAWQSGIAAAEWIDRALAPRGRGLD